MSRIGARRDVAYTTLGQGEGQRALIAGRLAVARHHHARGVAQTGHISPHPASSEAARSGAGSLLGAASRAGSAAVTYLFVKGKEFALFYIRVQRTEQGLRLDNAVLMRTGFMIPTFKERIYLRFEAPLPAGSLKDEVVEAALADTGLFMGDRR